MKPLTINWKKLGMVVGAALMIGSTIGMAIA